MTDQPHLLVDRRPNGVVLATLNRPEKLNALSNEMRIALYELVTALRTEESARVLVITGAGRGFCSGAEVGGGQRDGSRLFGTDPRFILAEQLRTLELPVIAAVNGAAAGAGLGLALACDVRLMSDKARLHPAFVKRGLGPDMSTSWRLPRLIGISRALLLLWSGDPVDAATALAIGLADRVHPADTLLEAALELADELAAGPKLALGLTKRSLYAALENPLLTQIQLEEYTQSILGATEDAREGALAFVEKRAPNFQGR